MISFTSFQNNLTIVLLVDINAGEGYPPWDKLPNFNEPTAWFEYPTYGDTRSYITFLPYPDAESLIRGEPCHDCRAFMLDNDEENPFSRKVSASDVVEIAALANTQLARYKSNVYYEPNIDGVNRRVRLNTKKQFYDYAKENGPHILMDMWLLMVEVEDTTNLVLRIWSNGDWDYVSYKNVALEDDKVPHTVVFTLPCWGAPVKILAKELANIFTDEINALGEEWLIEAAFSAEIVDDYIDFFFEQLISTGRC